MAGPDIQALLTGALEAVNKAAASALDQLEIKYLGRKGELTNVLRSIKDLPSDVRGRVGGEANVARQKLEQAIQDRRQQLSASVKIDLDITLPSLPPKVGHLHLVNEGIRTISRIFEEIGFEIVSREEIVSDWHAFESLNMGPDEPARDEWETFFMDAKVGDKEKFVLTPHSTSGTSLVMGGRKPPFKVLNVQKNYRRQSDASHAPMFHQFDGVYVDTNVTISHLRGIFEYFVKSFFGSDRQIRFRPFHFRFVEPGFEIDIDCAVCHGAGCKMCKEGWLELGGAGMLHPNVLKAAKIDPAKYSGLAFGWGVERTILMRGGLSIPDIRILYENDIRFLEQF
jgi:phenylalanyl-tRNA synthetase alpha chain